MNKIILIPSYQPDEKLIKLLEKIDRKEFHIIVVDDGSGKDYDEIFIKSKKYAQVIRYDTNHGKGYALKLGLKTIATKYDKDYIVVTMDSDGQHTIEDALKLCEYVSINPNTLVLGMRKRDGKVPLRSRIGNSITKAIYSIVSGVYVYDTQTGLRAFSDKLINFLTNISGDRFEYEMNVLLMCAKSHIPIHEIEIQTIYIEENKSSHFDTIKDSYRVYKEIIKFSLSSIICFLIDYILYIILFTITNYIVFANIGARIASATINYSINRKYVFKSNNNKTKSIISYILLALFIIIINTILLYILIEKLLINKWIAKIIVELFLFIISWIIQRTIIFKRKDNIHE